MIDIFQLIAQIVVVGTILGVVVGTQLIFWYFIIKIIIKVFKIKTR